jgi:guanylate kinase
MTDSPGKLVIISGPSGAGKSTVVRDLLQTCPLPLKLSVSATTRAARAGEVDGEHYWFLSQAEFLRRREKGEFLECFEVFGRGDWYGTPSQPVTSGLKAGQWIILEIDIQGARSVLESVPDAVTIFVQPRNIEELERRLRGRKSDSEAAIQRRLEVAREELRQAAWYQHLVINDEVSETSREICRLLHTYK